MSRQKSNIKNDNLILTNRDSIVRVRIASKKNIIIGALTTNFTTLLIALSIKVSLVLMTDLILLSYYGHYGLVTGT